MQSSFFRNVKNYEQLFMKTRQFTGIVAEYHIIQTIDLELEEYRHFCDNFQLSYSFLQKYTDKSVIVNDIWYCVLVHHNKSGVIILMNGYQYPRYVSIWKSI